jgi:hypothetical protein
VLLSKFTPKLHPSCWNGCEGAHSSSPLFDLPQSKWLQAFGRSQTCFHSLTYFFLTLIVCGNAIWSDSVETCSLSSLRGPGRRTRKL